MVSADAGTWGGGRRRGAAGASQGIALALLVAMTLAAVVLGLHEAVRPRVGHYATAARQSQAEQARRIVNDPRNPCQLYECSESSSTLRVCTGVTDEGKVVHALQWLWYNGTEWLEGTAFLQDKPHKVANYLRNNGCKPKE